MTSFYFNLISEVIELDTIKYIFELAFTMTNVQHNDSYTNQKCIFRFNAHIT